MGVVDRHRSVDYDKDMRYIPPAGTRMHCVKECQAAQKKDPANWDPKKFTWLTRKPGEPRRCGKECKSPYYDVFPKDYDPTKDICNLCKQIYLDKYADRSAKSKLA